MKFRGKFYQSSRHFYLYFLQRGKNKLRTYNLQISNTY